VHDDAARWCQLGRQGCEASTGTSPRWPSPQLLPTPPPTPPLLHVMLRTVAVKEATTLADPSHLLARSPCSAGRQQWQQTCWEAAASSCGWVGGGWCHLPLAPCAGAAARSSHLPRAACAAAAGCSSHLPQAACAAVAGSSASGVAACAAGEGTSCVEAAEPLCHHPLAACAAAAEPWAKKHGRGQPAWVSSLNKGDVPIMQPTL